MIIVQTISICSGIIHDIVTETCYWITCNVKTYLFRMHLLERTLEELEIAVDTFHKVAVELEGWFPTEAVWNTGHGDLKSHMFNNVSVKPGFLLKSPSMAFTYQHISTCAGLHCLHPLFCFHMNCQMPDARWVPEPVASPSSCPAAAAAAGGRAAGGARGRGSHGGNCRTGWYIN